MTIDLKRILGLVIAFVAIVWAWNAYGWQLPVIIFLALWSNNIDSK